MARAALVRVLQPLRPLRGEKDGMRLLVGEVQALLKHVALREHPVGLGEMVIPQTRPHRKRKRKQALHFTGGERLRPEIKDIKHKAHIRMPPLVGRQILRQKVRRQDGDDHLRLLLQLLEPAHGLLRKLPVRENAVGREILLVRAHVQLPAARNAAGKDLFSVMAEIRGEIYRLIAPALQIGIHGPQAVSVVIRAADEHRPLRLTPVFRTQGFSSSVCSKASVLSSGVSRTSTVRRMSLTSSHRLYS